jgi:hypothetical protein
MTVPPWAVAYVVTTVVAWSADHFNRYVITHTMKTTYSRKVLTSPSRGLHSAAFAFIGAMGFLASAVLPADAYLVRSPNHSLPPCIAN